MFTEFLQQILSWEQPVVSGAALFIIHILFWFILRFEWRFYGFVFFVYLCSFMANAFMEIYNIRTHERQALNWSQTIVTIVAASVESIRILKEKYPNNCHIYAIGLFFLLNILGRSISGFTITYLVVIGAFTTPLIIQFLPENTRKYFTTLYASLQPNVDITEEDLIPLTSSVSEKEIDNESVGPDSCSNSLMADIGPMPSFLEVENSLDGLDDDLEITGTAALILPSSTLNPDLSDSDSDNGEGNIELPPFNEENSSSDESKYLDDTDYTSLQNSLPNCDTTDGSDSLPSTILSSIPTSVVQNVSRMSQNLYTIIKQHGTDTKITAPRRSSSSDDGESDFELIDRNDIPDTLK